MCPKIGTVLYEIFALSEACSWETMAFPVVMEDLRHYVTDAKNGEFPVHLASLLDDPAF